jgi:hypothetical protein
MLAVVPETEIGHCYPQWDLGGGERSLPVDVGPRPHEEEEGVEKSSMVTLFCGLVLSAS